VCPNSINLFDVIVLTIFKNALPMVSDGGHKYRLRAPRKHLFHQPSPLLLCFFSHCFPPILSFLIYLASSYPLHRQRHAWTTLRSWWLAFHLFFLHSTSAEPEFRDSPLRASQPSPSPPLYSAPSLSLFRHSSPHGFELASMTRTALFGSATCTYRCHLSLFVCGCVDVPEGDCDVSLINFGSCIACRSKSMFCNHF
jgi:hypothetical protein